MNDHDQRFKELLKRFISQFFQLFLPGWLPVFRFDAIAWLDKEYHPNPPQGKRPRLDLVGQIRLNDEFRVFADEHGPDHSEAIIHIEIESDDSSVPIRKRDYRYYNYLRDKHDLPVFPIVLHLNVGLDGIGRTIYKEGFHVVRNADETAEAAIVIADDQVEYRYHHVCLPGLPGAEYLERNEILGVALSALMQIPKADRPLHQAKAIKRIVESGESEYNRYLAAECVHAYIGLNDQEWAQTQELLRDPVYSGTAAMITEVYRRTLEQARLAHEAALADAVADATAKTTLKTRREDVTRTLRARFPQNFDNSAAARIDTVDDLDTISRWLDHALFASSWKDFTQAVGWRGDHGPSDGNGIDPKD